MSVNQVQDVCHQPPPRPPGRPGRGIVLLHKLICARHAVGYSSLVLHKTENSLSSELLSPLLVLPRVVSVSLGPLEAVLK